MELTSANRESKNRWRASGLFATSVTCGLLLATISVLLVVCFILAAIFFDTWQGNTRYGATKYYLKAMDRGDAKTAIYYAEKLVKLRRDDYSHLDKMHVTFLARAYELNGEYDKALEAYAELPDKWYGGTYMGIARVSYKQEKHQEAFIAYCNHLIAHQNKTVIYKTVMCEIGGAKPYMSPFKTYQQFLDFMEEEYAKLENPASYQKAMEIYRNVGKKEWQTRTN